jgi:hypothetical protein
MALTQTESGILHVDDHHRHQYHHDEVYDVEHHTRAMSYDILGQNKDTSYDRKRAAGRTNITNSKVTAEKLK